MDAQASGIDPDELMLARLAAMDMAAAQEAHARFMDAKDQAESDRAGRTYQKMARSLRQTLLLKARLAGEARKVEREDAAIRRSENKERVSLRRRELRIAVEALASREIEAMDEEEYDDFGDRLFAIVEREALSDSFVAEDLGDQAARVLRELGFEVTDEGRVRRIPEPGSGPAPEPAFHDSA